MLYAFLNQILQNFRSCLTRGEAFADPCIPSVVAELVGNEAAYTSGYRRINQKLLEGYVVVVYSANDNILMFKGGGQRGQIKGGSNMGDPMRVSRNLVYTSKESEIEGDC